MSVTHKERAARRKLTTYKEIDMQGTKAERRMMKRAQLRDKYRDSVCIGCRHNRYNYQSDGNGWDSPTTGSGCWNLEEIKRGKCPVHSDYDRR